MGHCLNGLCRRLRDPDLLGGRADRVVTVCVAPPLAVLTVRAAPPAAGAPLFPGFAAGPDALCARLLDAAALLGGGLLAGGAFAAAGAGGAGAFVTVFVTAFVVFVAVFVTALFVFETVLVTAFVTPVTGLAAARCVANRRETSAPQMPTNSDRRRVRSVPAACGLRLLILSFRFRACHHDVLWVTPRCRTVRIPNAYLTTFLAIFIP